MKRSPGRISRTFAFRQKIRWLSPAAYARRLISRNVREADLFSNPLLVRRIVRFALLKDRYLSKKKRGEVLFYAENHYTLERLYTRAVANAIKKNKAKPLTEEEWVRVHERLNELSNAMSVIENYGLPLVFNEKPSHHPKARQFIRRLMSIRKALRRANPPEGPAVK